MKTRLFGLVLLISLAAAITSAVPAQAKSYIAYISDSTNSSVDHLDRQGGGHLQEARTRSRYDLYQRQRARHSEPDRRRSQLQRRSGNGGHQCQARRRRHRDYSKPDEHPALLHHRQCEHQVTGWAQGTSPRRCIFPAPRRISPCASRSSKVGINYKDIKAITVGGAPARLAAVTQGQADFTVVTDGEKIQGEKMGLKVVIDMAKTERPVSVQLHRHHAQKNPREPGRSAPRGLSMAEADSFFQDPQRGIGQNHGQVYPRLTPRNFGGARHTANSALLVEDTYPTLEGLKQTLDVQALTDPRAAKFKAEDMVDLRFVDDMKKSGFVDKLYGRK